MKMTKTLPPQIEKPRSAATAPRQTKAALLRARLAKPDGVSLTEMMRLTAWQAHTLRAALTGLRKTGVILSRRREGGDTLYAIDPAGSAHTSDGGVSQGAEAAEADPGIEPNGLVAPPVTARGLPDAAIPEPGQGAA